MNSLLSDLTKFSGEVVPIFLLVLTITSPIFIFLAYKCVSESFKKFNETQSLPIFSISHLIYVVLGLSSSFISIFIGFMTASAVGPKNILIDIFRYIVFFSFIFFPFSFFLSCLLSIFFRFKKQYQLALRSDLLPCFSFLGIICSLLVQSIFALFGNIFHQ